MVAFAGGAFIAVYRGVANSLEWLKRGSVCLHFFLETARTKGPEARFMRMIFYIDKS